MGRLLCVRQYPEHLVTYLLIRQMSSDLWSKSVVGNFVFLALGINLPATQGQEARLS